MNFLSWLAGVVVSVIATAILLIVFFSVFPGVKPVGELLFLLYGIVMGVVIGATVDLASGGRWSWFKWGCVFGHTTMFGLFTCWLYVRIFKKRYDERSEQT